MMEVWWRCYDGGVMMEVWWRCYDGGVMMEVWWRCSPVDDLLLSLLLPPAGSCDVEAEPGLLQRCFLHVEAGVSRPTGTLHGVSVSFTLLG